MASTTTAGRDDRDGDSRNGREDDNWNNRDHDDRDRNDRNDRNNCKERNRSHGARSDLNRLVETATGESWGYL